MGKWIDNLKKGNVDFEIPSDWSRRKAKWVVIGLLLFSVAFGMLSVAQDNSMLLSLCIFSAFLAGQIYCVYVYWDNFKKAEELVGKCIFLEEMEDGLFCSRGVTTVYDKVDKYEPRCNGCKRKTVVR